VYTPKGLGELCASEEPGMSEWGNPLVRSTRTAI